MVDGIIFDMDGLLVDTEKVWSPAKKYMCEKFGVPYSQEFDNVCRGTSGSTFVRVIEEFFRERGYTDFDGTAYMNEIWDYVDVKFEEGVEKKPGADEILAWTKEQGIPTAVASGSKPHQVKHHLEVVGLGDAFTMEISGFDIEHSKPAPDIFLRCSDALGTAPERTVVLEDSTNGIRAAVAGGFIPIMVPDREPAELAKGLYRYTCKDLFEVRDLLASGVV